MLNELAIEIKKRFTPFAFSCGCDGAECVQTRESDAYAISQNDVVNRIVEFILSQEDALNELNDFHFKIPGVGKNKNGDLQKDWCFHCRQDWPCSTNQIIHWKQNER
jgi:hypothetical protein